MCMSARWSCKRSCTRERLPLTRNHFLPPPAPGRLGTPVLEREYMNVGQEEGKGRKFGDCGGCGEVAPFKPAELGKAPSGIRRRGWSCPPAFEALGLCGRVCVCECFLEGASLPPYMWAAFSRREGVPGRSLAVEGGSYTRLQCTEEEVAAASCPEAGRGVLRSVPPPPPVVIR